MGREKAYNMSASWIGNMEKGKKKVKEQEWQNISVLKPKAALTKSQKLKSTGIDKVPNFWVNVHSLSHATFTRLLNEIMQNPEKAPTCVYKGTTYLLAKRNDKKDP